MTTRKSFWPSLALAITLMPVGSNAENTTPTSPTEQFSYALGFQIGTQIARQMMTEGLNLDPGYLAQAIEDVLSGATPAITQAEMDAAITAIQQQSQEFKDLTFSQLLLQPKNSRSSSSRAAGRAST